jgi:hypothetical protein
MPRHIRRLSGAGYCRIKRERLGSGDPPGLQNRRSFFSGDGVFDSHALPPYRDLTTITLSVRYRGYRNGYRMQSAAHACHAIDISLNEEMGGKGCIYERSSSKMDRFDWRFSATEIVGEKTAHQDREKVR